MKFSSLTLFACCLLMAGCQSSNGLSSRLTGNMFSPKKSQHTLSTNPADQSSPSALQLSSDEFRQGEQALQAGNLKKAKQYFIAVVKLQPRNAAAHHRLGYIADKTNDFTSAEIHYITALKIEPNNADIACDLGYSYLLQDRLRDAQRHFEKALVSNPQHQSSLLNMATLRAKQNDYDGALAIFRQAGTEQQAQENIARLFPQGHPGGSMAGATIDQSKNPLTNPRQALNQNTNNLQNEMAALINKKRLENERNKPKKTAWDHLQPKKTPNEDINNIFAEIDQEYGKKQKQLSTLPPDNRVILPQNPQPKQQEPIAQIPPQNLPQNRQPIQPAGNYPSSVPGNLTPSQPAASSNDYAVLLPQNNTPTAPKNPPLNNNPAFNSTTPPAIPANDTNNQSAFNPPAIQNHPAQNYPAQNPPVQNVSVPQSQYQNNIYQAPPQNPAQNLLTASGANNNPASYQQAVALAVQMGMNAGPGQMFPMNSNSQSQPAGNNYYGQTSILPASTQQNNPAIPQQNYPAKKHTHPFEHLPIQSPSPSLHAPITAPATTIPTYPQENPTQYPVEQSPPPIATNNPNGASTGTIKNWPYAPNPQYQHVSGEQKPEQTNRVQQAGSQTPWLNMPAVQPGTQPPFSTRKTEANRQNQSNMPAMQPGNGNNNIHAPQQWAHSPQAGASPPVINRGTLPPQNLQSPANRATPLPQIIPGTR